MQITKELMIIKCHDIRCIPVPCFLCIDHAHGILTQFRDFNCIVVGPRAAIQVRTANQMKIHRIVAGHSLPIEETRYLK